MTRWVFGALVVFVSLDLSACPLCLGSFQPTVAQQLVDVRHAVLAVSTAEASRFRVVETVKGERPRGTIEAGYPRTAADTKPPKSGKPLLLVRDDMWPMWVIAGTIGAEHADWLRKIAAGKRPAAMNADEWRARVALVLPYLQHRDPLAADIAYSELASAPYSAMLTARARLDLHAIRRWVADPELAARAPLYLLLLGISGNAEDTMALELRLEAAWRAGDATNLGSMLAANLQLRGPARLEWVDAKYLRDPKRSSHEVAAALLALSVHGNVNAAIPREGVIRSYRIFMQAHRESAGYVAQDLAAWMYWDAVPEYVALLQSDVKQHYASRVSILAYLRQSPVAEARALALKNSGEPDPRR